MARREFKRSVRVEIVKRATRDNVTYCEACGLPTKRWHIDHIDADAFQLDKSRPLTADDGQLLCAGSRETCHGRKTAELDVPLIAQAKRREAKHLGIRPPSRIPRRGFSPAPERDRTPCAKVARGPSGFARQIREETP